MSYVTNELTPAFCAHELRRIADRALEIKTESWSVDVFALRSIAEWIEWRKESAEQNRSEPKIEDCIAAIKRNKHRKDSTWEASAVSQRTFETLNETEVRAIGAYYIERERSGEKGGES